MSLLSKTGQITIFYNDLRRLLTTRFRKKRYWANKNRTQQFGTYICCIGAEELSLKRKPVKNQTQKIFVIDKIYKRLRYFAYQRFCQAFQA